MNKSVLIGSVVIIAAAAVVAAAFQLNSNLEKESKTSSEFTPTADNETQNQTLIENKAVTQTAETNDKNATTQEQNRQTNLRASINILTPVSGSYLLGEPLKVSWDTLESENENVTLTLLNSDGTYLGTITTVSTGTKTYVWYPDYVTADNKKIAIPGDRKYIIKATLDNGDSTTSDSFELAYGGPPASGSN